MTSYFEYGVNLTDNQKRNLASAMNSKSPLTLRIKHSKLTGNDKLMLTKTQLKRIQKSLNNGTGADIKISKTQIRKVAKQGGSLFSTLASLGARVLPYAVKGLKKKLHPLWLLVLFLLWEVWVLIRYLAKECISPYTRYCQCIHTITNRSN